MTRRLSRRFYRRSAPEVAPELLNKVLVHGGRAGRIVEVEAYRGELDPASHAYRGQTARNASMFGAPGLLYVYFTYGMHWCANVVCAVPGVAEAVLIRALEPLRGQEEMRVARGAAAAGPRGDRLLASGPARLCQALGIDGTFDGLDLTRAERAVTVVDDGTPPPTEPASGPRVGIRVGTELEWRYWVPDSPFRSR